MNVQQKEQMQAKVQVMASEMQAAMRDTIRMFPLIACIPCAIMVTLMNGSITIGLIFLAVIVTLKVFHKV